MNTIGTLETFETTVSVEYFDVDEEGEVIDNCLMDDIPAGIEWMHMATGESVWTICSNAILATLSSPFGGLNGIRDLINSMTPILE